MPRRDRAADSISFQMGLVLLAAALAVLLSFVASWVGIWIVSGFLQRLSEAL